MMKKEKPQLYFHKDAKMIKQTYPHQHPNPTSKSWMHETEREIEMAIGGVK